MVHFISILFCRNIAVKKRSLNSRLAKEQLGFFDTNYFMTLLLNGVRVCYHPYVSGLLVYGSSGK